MTTELIKKNIGNSLPEKVRYSEQSNSFLTNGYVSRAQNVYFNSIRFAEGIVIKEDVGQGYKYTFLNGLRIYSLKDKTLLADRSYRCNIYKKDNIRFEIKEMLLDLIKDACEKNGQEINYYDLKRSINELINRAFNENQQDVLKNQVKRLQ